MKTTTKILYVVTESLLAITAFICLAISMFGNQDTNLPLQIALGSTGLGGILTMLYQIKKTKTEKQAKE